MYNKSAVGRFIPIRSFWLLPFLHSVTVTMLIILNQSSIRLYDVSIQIERGHTPGTVIEKESLVMFVLNVLIIETKVPPDSAFVCLGAWKVALFRCKFLDIPKLEVAAPMFHRLEQSPTRFPVLITIH